MLEHKERFDLSNFPKDSTYYDLTNKKVTRKMKDEYPKTSIKEVMAIKSKSYIVITKMIKNNANIKDMTMISQVMNTEM